MKIGRVTAVALCLLAALAAGCTREAPPVAAAPPPPPPAASFLKPVASVLDLMEGQVEPSSKFIWDAVSTENTAKGPVDHQPKTDADWKAVRLNALQLAEAANLLVMEGRRVAHEGQTLRDKPGPTDYLPERAQQEIDANRATFVAFARALQDTAMAAAASADKRSVDALLDAGGAIDEACEQCHKRFWYPEAPAGDPEPPRATPQTGQSKAPAAAK
jgi:hypothetical protein